MNNNNPNLKFGHNVRITRPGSLDGLKGRVVKLKNKRVFVKVKGRPTLLYVRKTEVKRLPASSSSSAKKAA